MTTTGLRPHGERQLQWCLLIGALVGAAIGLRTLDPAFIAGDGGKWVRPENDYTAYLVAWNYYIVDQWRWPLFDLPIMGYPEGGSVLFNDALPLGVFPSKILYKIAGVRVNPFGWWIFLTYVLQGLMAARIVCAVGVRSIWACAAAAVLAIVNTGFASRMGHTALSSHFLLLWAMAMHFESLRRGRARIWEYTLALALAILINSYLFAMVFAFQLATFFVLVLRRQLSLRDVASAGAGMLGVAAIGVAAGYGVFLSNPTSMKSEGFGLYSWNLVGLLVPPKGVFGYFAGIARDGTRGQYEGESYIGLGALVVLALSLVLVPRYALSAARRYWVYVAVLCAFAVYAASNLVYAGTVLVVKYPLPQVVMDLGNYYRATGRFIWPVAYSLMILPIAALFRWRPAALAIPVAVLGVYLQLQEGLPGIAWRRVLTTQASVDLIDAPRVDAWLRQHQRLFQYPSWVCGGIGGSKRSWGNRESNRELQVQLAAARAGIPTNSVYTSRVLKNCPTEFTWGPDPRLENGVLYLLSPETVSTSPTLTALARSNACVTLDWAIVCSRKWALMAEAKTVPPPGPNK